MFEWLADCKFHWRYWVLAAVLVGVGLFLFFTSYSQPEVSTWAIVVGIVGAGMFGSGVGLTFGYLLACIGSGEWL